MKPERIQEPQGSFTEPTQEHELFRHSTRARDLVELLELFKRAVRLAEAGFDLDLAVHRMPAAGAAGAAGEAGAMDYIVETRASHCGDDLDGQRRHFEEIVLDA